MGSTVSAQVAMLHRNVTAGDPLANLLARNALTYGADTLLRFKGGEYELVWAGLGTLVSGEAAAMEAIQRAPEHYMQRPDKDYGLLDPRRTSLTGYSQTMSFNRISGTTLAVRRVVHLRQRRVRSQSDRSDERRRRYPAELQSHVSRNVARSSVSKLLDSPQSAERMEPRLESSDRDRGQHGQPDVAELLDVVVSASPDCFAEKRHSSPEADR